MTSKSVGKCNSVIAVAAAASILMPAPVAYASDAAKVLGGIAAGVGITLGVQHLNKNRQQQQQRTTRTRSAPQQWSAARHERASVQRALNDFGFPVGSADGKFGPNTRRGISNYQAFMGYPPTGELLPYQQQALLSAHGSYTSGAANSLYPGLIQSEGVGGVLKATADPNYYNSRYGNRAQTGAVGNTGNYGNAATHGVTGSAVGAPPVQPPPPIPAQNNGTTLVGTNPQTVVPETGIATGGGAVAALPKLGKIGQVEASMQDHCDIVKLNTQTNGFMQSPSNLTDPKQALNEQFCDARMYLMSGVQTTLGQVRASEDELVAACEQIATAVKPVMTSLGSKSAAAATAEVSGIAGTLGLNDPAAAAEYGQLCLGLGYRGNDSDMALAGALVVTSAGNAPYAEMVGHHIREGFGASANGQSANEWIGMSLDALDSNQPPAVLPSQTIQRTSTLRAAIDAQNQRAGATQPPVVVPVANSALPPLTLGNN